MKAFFFPLLFVSLASCAQTVPTPPAAGKPVGGRCEGCEAVYETKVPFAQLNWVDTLPVFAEAGP